ncbi:MAG: hypothetical protein V4511_02995 [Bacteroidota bacterium]
MNNYKFYITHNSITTEVFPLYTKLEFIWKKEGVRFRKDLKTEFKFINDPKHSITDFTRLLAIETGSLRCDEIDFEIKKSCDRGRTYTSYWTGSFATNDGFFNLSQCNYKVKPQVVDQYTCIYKKLNDEYNLLLSGPLITIKNITQFNYEFYYCDITGVSQPVADPNTLRICFPSPSAEDATWTELYNDIACYDFDCTAYVGNLIVYIRERVVSVNVGGVSTPPTGSGWVEVSGSDNGETTTYVRPYTGVLPVITNTIVNIACDGSPTLIGGLSYVKLYFTNLSSNCADGADWYWSPPEAVKTYTQSRTLYNAMLYLLNQACPTLTALVSDFFEWNPIGDAPGYVAGINYVTGLNNVISNIAIAQKSDVIDPTATQHATSGTINLKTILENFKKIFNVDWFIDASGNFRIEHEKYFSYSVGFTSTSAPHAQWNDANEIYSYKKEDMPSKESFKFMESQGIDFVGKSITYSGACVTYGASGIKEYVADKFSTDINFIENQPSDIDRTGFVLIVYEQIGSTLFIAKEAGKLTGALIANAHLSWANLHYNYHRYGRVLLTGNMNGSNETFLSAKRNKVQSNVKLLICCTDPFNPNGILVQTELGTGEIESAEEVEEIVTLSINL